MTALELTPFAREEFVLARRDHDDPVESARRLVVRSFMGVGSNSHKVARVTGFRSINRGTVSPPPVSWRTYPAALVEIVDRLQGVVVENRDAMKVMAQYDDRDALHYVDPPYVHATRRDVGSDGYMHEMSDDDHCALLSGLRELRGAVVLSGYRHAIYDEAMADWTRFDRAAMADGARRRVESLWLNPAAVERMPQTQLGVA